MGHLPPVTLLRHLLAAQMATTSMATRLCSCQKGAHTLNQQTRMSQGAWMVQEEQTVKISQSASSLHVTCVASIAMRSTGQQARKFATTMAVSCKRVKCTVRVPLRQLHPHPHLPPLPH